MVGTLTVSDYIAKSPPKAKLAKVRVKERRRSNRPGGEEG
jgi:hypothetical protein